MKKENQIQKTFEGPLEVKIAKTTDPRNTVGHHLEVNPKENIVFLPQDATATIQKHLHGERVHVSYKGLNFHWSANDFRGLFRNGVELH